LIYNKSDKISDLVKNTYINLRVITETWLILVISQTRIFLVMWFQVNIDSIMHLGFARKVEESAFSFMSLWSVKTICDFRLSLENYQITFVSGGISVHVNIIYRLHQTKNCFMKTADFFKECSEFIDSLASNSGYLLIWLTVFELPSSDTMCKKEHTDMVTC